MSLKRVRVDVPKVRRNAKEVRPYTELPQRGLSDNALLWGTACLLFALTLGGGAYLWQEARISAPTSEFASSAGGLRVQDYLMEARDSYIRGDFGRSVSSAQVALALEQARPSQPPLEGEVRRVLALSHQSQQQLGKAMEQWEWLRSRDRAFKDQQSYQRCREALERESQKQALQQLRQAQQLYAQGQLRRALAEARQAQKLLERGHASKDTLRAAYLLVAQVATRLGEAVVAREALQSLAQVVKLTEDQRKWLAQLKEPQPAAVRVRPASPAATVRVIVPSLGEGPQYPLGNPGSRRTTLKDGSLPGEPAVANLPPPSQPIPSAPPGKKLELPRLEMPDSSPRGSLPSYQGSQGKSLPNYRDQSGDSLPTYSGKPQIGGKLPGY